MQNRKTNKSAFLLLLAVTVFLISFFVIDKFALARFLGSAYATIFDPPFTILLIIGSLTTLKFGALTSAIVCSLLYTTATFAVIRDWQIELGIYRGATFLLFQKLSTTLLASTILFSVVGSSYLLIRSIFRSPSEAEPTSRKQKIWEKQWESAAGNEYSIYDAEFDDSGTLMITGQDISATAEKIWGDDEVEYYYDIPKPKQRSLALRLIAKSPLRMSYWMSYARPNPLLIDSLIYAFQNDDMRKYALSEIKKLNTREISMW